MEVKKHKVTARFPGSDQGIEVATVNGGMVLEKISDKKKQ